MRSSWNESDANKWQDDAGGTDADKALARRVYSSRLIGADPDLVLHGGGNTSVKVMREGRDILHVKGSGWDLATLEAPGLPGLELAALLETRNGGRLSDPDMVALLRHNMITPSGPNPSVETLLHAFIPAKYVDHTHAAAALVIADQPDAAELARTIFGKRLTIVPYVMPGFDLAVEADRLFRQHPGSEGLFLVNHGLFSFGDDARSSFESMIAMTRACEDFIASRGAALAPPAANRRPQEPAPAAALSAALRYFEPFSKSLTIDVRCNDPVDAFLALPNLEDVVGRGTITPDHVIRLKPSPLIGDASDTVDQWTRRIDDYCRNYAAYFNRYASHAAEPKTMLDALPRVALIRGFGVAGIGRDAKEACICADLIDQGARVMVAAEKLGRFTPISERDLFDMEYWSLEQAKLKNAQ